MYLRNRMNVVSLSVERSIKFWIQTDLDSSLDSYGDLDKLN